MKTVPNKVFFFFFEGGGSPTGSNISELANYTFFLSAHVAPGHMYISTAKKEVYGFQNETWRIIYCKITHRYTNRKLEKKITYLYCYKVKKRDKNKIKIKREGELVQKMFKNNLFVAD